MGAPARDAPPLLHAVGPLSAAALPQAVRVLARAFRENPLNRVVLSGHSAAARERANAHGMRAHLPPALERGLARGARSGPSGALSGVLVGAPPGRWPLPPPGFGARLRCLLGQGPRVAAAWARVSRALEEHHPVAPHWYLATLGVDPAWRGRSSGRALLEGWLAEVDADGRPAWLETDSEANLRFYERSGFAVRREIRVLGVPVWALARTGAGPRPAAGARLTAGPGAPSAAGRPGGSEAADDEEGDR